MVFKLRNLKDMKKEIPSKKGADIHIITLYKTLTCTRNYIPPQHRIISNRLIFLIDEKKEQE